MIESSKLLIDEPPLQVLPTLAKHLDINKAIILQQIQYWIARSKHQKGPSRWIYNSYKDWAEQFPWLTERAIRWHIKQLEKMNLLIAGEFNKDRRDNTKWYRINYDKLNELTELSCGLSTADTPPDEECHMQMATIDELLPETSSETSKEQWESVLKLLKKNVSPAFFATYLEHTVGVRSGNGVFIVEVQNEQLAWELNTRHISRIQLYFGKVTGSDQEVKFLVKGEV